MKSLENPRNLRKLARINDEKARAEICRVVIKEFSKAKREFVAAYCGQDKEFQLYKDSVTKLSTTFKAAAKEIILTDCPLQNQLFNAIANYYMGVEESVLFLMSLSVIPVQAEAVLEKDHDLEKMFSVAYAWQSVVCWHGLNELITVDEKYRWHITHDLFVGSPFDDDDDD